MKLYRISACEHINDLSGRGAFLHGGRWNSKGVHLLYTAENAALSILEALAHITMANAKRSYCKTVLHFLESEQFVFQDAVKKLQIEQLPAGWRSSPGPDVLKEMGDAFVQEGKFLALKVPSVLVPDSFNYLLNPLHPLNKHLEVLKTEQVHFDQRLVSRK